MAEKKFSKRELTDHIKRLAMEAFDITAADGTPITRAEKLAMLLWDRALGYEESDPDQPNKKVRYRPEAWAIQYVYDRCEGKVGQVTPDETGNGLPIAEQVGELHVAALNLMTDSATGEVPPPPPSVRKPAE